MPDHPDPIAEARDIAKAILDGTKPTPDLWYWQLATAGEACLVLGWDDDAFYWTAHYVGSEHADGFEYASTMRQLEQSWQLNTVPRRG